MSQTLEQLEVSIASHEEPRSYLLTKWMPGLDAVRGAAVLSVVLRHGFSYFDDVRAERSVRLISEAFRFGWLGVPLFFVLSGFLITGILIDSRNSPNYWRKFCTRRALRILPLFIITLLLAHVVLGSEWRYIILCFLFLANLIEGGPWKVYNPLWSLAVEEQFYLVWPLLVRYLSLRGLGAICLVSITISPVLRYLSTFYPIGNPYDATWLISDGLCMGALLAILLRSRLSSRRDTDRLIVGMAAVATIFAALGIHFHTFSRASRAGTALQGEPFLFFFAFLVLLALKYGARQEIMRYTSWLRFLGYISYGLYLLHLLVFVVYDRFVTVPYVGLAYGRLKFVLIRFAVVFAVSVLLCFISRRYIEEYFLRFKRRPALNRLRRIPSFSRTQRRI